MEEGGDIKATDITKNKPMVARPIAVAVNEAIQKLRSSIEAPIPERRNSKEKAIIGMMIQKDPIKPMMANRILKGRLAGTHAKKIATMMATQTMRKR